MIILSKFLISDFMSHYNSWLHNFWLFQLEMVGHYHRWPPSSSTLGPHTEEDANRLAIQTADNYGQRVSQKWSILTWRSRIKPTVATIVASEGEAIVRTAEDSNDCHRHSSRGFSCSSISPDSEPISSCSGCLGHTVITSRIDSRTATDAESLRRSETPTKTTTDVRCLASLLKLSLVCK